MKVSPAWFYGGLIFILSAWILHSFLQAVLAACVTAIAGCASLHRFRRVCPRRVGRSSKSLIFTLAMTVFVLAPVMFAFGALLNEAHALLAEIAAADMKGIAVPQGLENVPLIGPWLSGRWQNPVRLFRHASDVDAADRRNSAPCVGAVARTIHGATRVHHRIHDPAVVRPVWPDGESLFRQL